MHDIVVLATYCEEMHGMSLYDVVLSYIHNLCLSDYMMKVLLQMNEESILAMLMFEVDNMLVVS